MKVLICEMRAFILTLLLSVFSSAQAATEIAITVDDLPGHKFDHGDPLEITRTMLAAFRKHHLTGIYGMVNGKRAQEAPDARGVLELWLSSGQLLANHTWSHSDLAKTPLADYLIDIDKNENLLHELMGKRDYHYFRYPFLAEGDSAEKRNGVRLYLAEHQYKIAPVTVDFFDFEWIEPYQRCLTQHDDRAVQWLKTSYLDNAAGAIEIAQRLSVLDFNRPIKHVLLLHLGQIEAQMMDALLTAYEARGVKFIPLAEALADPVYQINPNVLHKRSYTFLVQVQNSKHLNNPPEVTAVYNSLPENELAVACK